MSPRAFLILLVFTLVAVAGAVWAIDDRERAVATAAVDEPLFAGLDDRLGDVSRIRIDNDEETITAVKGDDGWVIEEKDGYPAQPDSLRALVLGLANARLVEAKTSDPERYARLDLEDPGTEDNASQRIDIGDADGNTIASLIVGKKKLGLFGAGRAGNYVRREGESESWLTDRSFDLPAQPLDWLDQSIIDLPRDNVEEVALATGSDDPIVIRASDDDEEFMLENVPEGRAADFDKLRRVAGTLSGLNLNDVRPAGEVVFGDGAERARYRTTDGLVIDVALITEGDGEDAQSWIQLQASQEEAVAAPDASSEEEPRASVGQAPELNLKFGPWAFAIPDYLAERLAYRMDDLLAEPGDDSTS